MLCTCGYGSHAVSRSAIVPLFSSLTVIGCTLGCGGALSTTPDGVADSTTPEAVADSTTPEAVADSTAPDAIADSTTPDLVVESTPASASDGDEPEAMDAASMAISDASDRAASDLQDATVIDAPPPDAGLTPAEGGFLCVRGGGCQFQICYDADIICDRATQWCWVTGGGLQCQLGNDGCQSWDNLSDACPEEFHSGPPPDAAADGAADAAALACDSGLHRCACITLTDTYFCRCQDDDAGGVTLCCGDQC
jgi:hypothetical protein